MTENEQIALPLGITFEREVSVSANWGDFATNLSDSAVALFFEGPVGAAKTSLGAVIKLIGSAKIECSPGEKAWELATFAFAWALDQIKADGSFDVAILKSAMKGAIASAKAQTESTGVFIPRTFTDRPTTLPLYQILRDEVIKTREILSSSKSVSESESIYKLDQAFNQAVFEIWSSKPDYYQSLISALKIEFSHGAESALCWKTYRQRLISEFEIRPVFGQEETKASLAQLYIPLRGYYRKPDNSPLTDFDHDLPRFHDVVVIDDALQSWIESGDDNDWVRLIGGGPGSGKSTTLRRLARYLADKPQWRPLYIPLQHINFEADLRTEINSFFKNQTFGAFSFDPLSRSSVEDGSPLVLIFDGLDELAAPNESAKEVVSIFAHRLGTLYAALNPTGNRTVRVVVSGRMPAFQAAKRFLAPPLGGSLETYGFSPAETGAENIDRLWKVDQRPVWWRQYARVAGEREILPPAMSSARLKGITHEPLLCYLLALAGYATSHWEQAAENRNRIYSALMDSVYHRGWGEGAIKRQGFGRSLTHDDFNTLMQTIALAAWLGGDTRVASQDRFEAAVEIMRAGPAWEEFQKDNGPDVSNLAMNFYLKAAEKEQRGFEFTHKSFGEYLAAKALLAVADEASQAVDRRLEHGLQEWANATRTGSVTDEVLTFLRDEVRLTTSEDNKEDIVKKKRAFERIVTAGMADGFPVSAFSGRFRALESEQANSECAAWAVLNSYVKAIANLDPTAAAIDIEWTQQFQLPDLLQRLDLVRPSIISKCMSYVRIGNPMFFGNYGSELNLEGSKISNAYFFNCTFYNASFANAELTTSIFVNCEIRKTSFNNAALKSCVFTGCGMEGVTFLNAHAENITLDSRTLVISDEDSLEPIMANAVLDNDRWGRDILEADRLARIKDVISMLEGKSREA